MFRLIVRYLFLAILATAAVAVLFFWRADDRAPLWAARDACQVSPSPQCLADLAAAQLLARDSLPDYLPEIGYLARLGRFDLARAVAAHWVGVTENSKGDVVKVLAPHVFAAAVRDGAGFENAWQQAGGGTDTRLLYIAALDLLGKSPYGAAFAPRRPVKPANRAIARIMAELGDLDDMGARMDGMDDLFQAWRHVVHPRLSEARIAQVLAIADQALTPDQQRLIRAGLAVDMGVQGKTARALALTRVLLEIALEGGAESYQLWAQLTPVGFATGDTALLETLMSNRARAAVAQGAPNKLLRTALSMTALGDGAQFRAD